MRYLLPRLLISLLILGPLLAGCAGKQPTMHYYQLAAISSTTNPAGEKLPELSLGVGPVTIPEMLKRQEIVVQGENNQYRLVDLHRWAGLLEKDLEAVIRINLSNLLGTEQILGFPWGGYFEPDYRVTIEIITLAGKPGDQVSLKAGWSIIDGAGEQLLVRKVSEYQHHTADQSYGSLVATKNQTINLLCQDISYSLRSLRNRPHP